MARVRTLTAWSGLDFNYSHGEIIELDDGVAEARVNAGLAEYITLDTKKKQAEKPAPVEPQN